MLIAIKASVTRNDPKQSKNNSLDIQHSLQECNQFLHLQTKPGYQPTAGQTVRPKKKNSHFFRCVLMLCGAIVEQLTLKLTAAYIQQFCALTSFRSLQM